jgi:hypothetical protein
MAITKSAVTALTSASIAAGGTKAAPSTGGTGSWLDITGAYGGDLSWRLINGSSAPGVAPTMTIQASPDNGTTVFDYATFGGDTTASSDNSGTIWIDQGIQYVRVIVYGNTTNAITASASLSKITAV